VLQSLFGTRADARGDGRRRRGGEQARLIRSAADINPRAKHPDMAPSGSKSPRVYILGEAPGEEEDARGVQFVGKSGKRLRELLPRGVETELRWNNACRTRPPENRTPTPEEVEFYRLALLADIEATRPAVVMAVGGTAIATLLPDLGRDVELSRGRRFPLRVGKHEAWVCPVHHPAYIMRVENDRKTDGDVPGEEWRRVWERDVAGVFKLASSLEPPAPYDLALIDNGIDLLTDVGAILEQLRIASHPNNASSAASHAFDIETSRLRPYYADAQLLTIAIATGQHAFAFPLDHAEANFSPQDREAIWSAFLGWLSTPARKIAHNLAFELEWIAHRGGGLRRARWGDTQADAYVLDERKNGHGLEFLTLLRFGFAIKKHSSVSRKRAAGEHLNTLLRYNARDAKFTLMLSAVQERDLRREGLIAIRDEHVRRIPSAVGMQCKGLLVDQKRRAQFDEELARDLDQLRRGMSARPEVEEYRKRFGAFNPASNDDLARMFRDVLGRREGERKLGKYSTDEDTLKLMTDVPLAAEILRLRQTSKLKSTYVDRLNPAHRDSYVWPDGRIHAQFKTLATDTGRLASEEPNGQNWPKRKRADIRAQIVPSPGHLFVAVDYAQIEARVIAMLSGDRNLVRSIHERYDIHLEWAQRIAKEHPPVLDRYDGDVKKFRKIDVKSSWTFPLFYGAKVELVAALLEIPRQKAEKLYNEFWGQFPGVQAWGRELRRNYRRDGYVETLTGRRRHAPLSDNMIGNTPSQGTASDIVVDAMNRLSELAEETGQPWFQPNLNIHDDLTFEVPERELERATSTIVEAMVSGDYPWFNDIPIEVEVSVGRNWYELDPIGKFSSDEAA